jgi:hypothetical protein
VTAVTRITTVSTTELRIGCVKSAEGVSERDGVSAIGSPLEVERAALAFNRMQERLQ